MLHGGRGECLLDLSANINPLGMPEQVRKAAERSIASCELYPDPECEKLRSLLSERIGVPAENIIAGNGAADIIYRLTHALRPEKAAIIAPTFSEYRKALEECGCTVTEHRLSPEEGFLPDESILDAAIGDADILFLCSPNNPTGRLLPPQLLRYAAEQCRQHRTLLFCDESFIGFTENGVSLLEYLNECCIILRAFTKLYAMPGLRLGYAVFGSSELAQSTARSGQFWSVSTPAQAAGIAALSADVSGTVPLISRERAFLSEGLAALGLRTFPSDANFILFEAPEGFFEAMLCKGIMLRPCESFGLSGYIRTAVRLHEDNVTLLNAAKECLQWL